MTQIDYRALLQDALLEMRQLRTELETLQQTQSNKQSPSEKLSQLEPIAIIGMDCRFPGAASPEDYWELLRNGVDAIREIPSERWDVDVYYDPNPDAPGKIYSRYGGFLDQVDQFDPQFFGISPREAISLDPQQRLLLEVSYTALERAGQSPQQLQGSQTGVFVGLSFDDYANRSLHSGDPTRIDAYSSLGNTRSIAVGRIAYVLGLQGPVMQLDTTCSSSLLAVHLACQSLRNRECDLALTGGVSLMLTPEPMIGFCKLKALASDGRSRTFDANATGYGRGEGCGIVVLKRLKDAITNQDNILAIIRGSAVNHDGQSNGLTAPNGTAQTAVIRQAVENAQVEPHQIQYVEAHGTGTPLGDPIEVLALGKALCEGRTVDSPLRIGSVKTNIGHLEAAAGVASLIKVVLSLQHQQIPPHLHLQQPNPHIPWDKLSIEVPIRLTEWTAETGNRLAGVSAFGMSGTNVHLVVQNADDYAILEEGLDQTQKLSLLTLSAKTETALRQLVQNYRIFLQASPEHSLKNICFTANTGRSYFDCRIACVAGSKEELCHQLGSFLDNKTVSGLFFSRGIQSVSTVTFVSTVQANQRSEIGQLPDQTDPISFQTIDRWAALLQPYLNIPLSEVLNTDDPDSDFHGTNIRLLNSYLNPVDNHYSDRRTILTVLAQLYTQGVPINWNVFEHHPDRQRLVLPTYPFQRQRYWLETVSPRLQTSQTRVVHPLLGQQLHLAHGQSIYFEQALTHAPSYLKQHRIFSRAVMPVAGYVEMALAAGREVLGSEIELINIAIDQALPIADGTIVQLVLTSDQGGYQFEVFARSESTSLEWRQHAAGEVSKVAEHLIQGIDSMRQSAHYQEICVDEFYQSCRERGIEYGAAFQVIERLWQGANEAIGKITLPNTATANYHLHPILLDAALQVIGAALPSDQTCLPIELERFAFYKPPTNSLWSYVQVRVDQGSWLADIHLFDHDLFDFDSFVYQLHDIQPIATIAGLRLQPTQAKAKDWFYQVEWRPQPLPCASDSTSSPIDLCDSLVTHLPHLTGQPEPIAYGKLLPQLEQLSLGYIINAFRTLGWSLQPYQCLTIETIAQQLGITSQYRRLLHRLLEILSEVNILEYDNGCWRVLQELPGETQINIHRNNSDVTPELTLLRRCGSQLANVLRGDTEPIQLLFPDGDLNTATQLYQNSAGAILMNTLVQQAIKMVISRKPAQQPLRILEIGAGTGGTTAYVLPLLDATTVTYWFTDISPLFTTQAQQTFQNYSFVQYQTLDIEKPLLPQGYSLQFYDVVIAANVIHATADIRHSLAQIHQLLKPDGLLVMLEGVCPMRWLDLIFGLTAGWWRFTDRTLRPHYPLLSASQWQQVLEQSGFSASTLTPDLDGIIQQSVIIGQVQPQAMWLILSDRQGVGDSLANQLRGKGYAVTLIFSGADHRQFTEAEYQINPTDRSQFKEVFNQAFPFVLKDTQINIVYLWSLDISSHITSASLTASNRSVSESILNLVQTIIHLPISRLWLITQQAVSVYSDDLPSLPQSMLWGLSKVIELEHPEWRCCCIDIDQFASERDLLNELLTPTSESQIVWRQRQRYVARLSRYQLEVPTKSSQLTVSERGTIENLSFQSMLRRSPNAGEVEIRIYTTGLNFRDLLNALGLYPEEAEALGCECVGEIAAVGVGVDQFNLGDQVMAIAPGSFSQYVTVNAAMVTHKPSNLNLEEAATLPVTFLTAFYALHKLANLQQGERVLIHAAAGGVGQAAVQLAQQIGAEIFATASPDKWEALQAMGVTQIFNSRSLDFATQIRQSMQGEGVDVVLNSLASEFIAASQSVLKPNGRFIELGKPKPDEVGTPDSLNMQRVDLVELCQQPDLIQAMLRELIPQFQTGRLQPLPFVVYPIHQVQQAFRTMQQAKHVGKIVVSQGTRSVRHSNETLIHPDATYLITGGLGGLGLLSSEWLVQQGAKHLVLVSHRERAFSPPQIQKIEQSGVQVLIKYVDVAQQAAMIELIQTVTSTMPPLRGVFHAAGVLQDSSLQQMSQQQIAAVLDPKILGAWNLHELTQSQPLDFFVLFSSATALFGSPGQANHVAANRMLDALAHYRQTMGLPALSINWGIWSDVGSATQQTAQMSRKGIDAIAPQNISLLSQLLQQSVAQVGVVPIRWQTFLQQSNVSNFLADFVQIRNKAVSQQPQVSEPHSGLLQQIQLAEPEQRRALLAQHIREQLAQVLGFQTAEIDLQKGFFDLGMDSLTSVELKNRLQRSLNISLSSTLIFDYPTGITLIDYLLSQIPQSVDVFSSISSSLSNAISSSDPNPIQAEPSLSLTPDRIASLLAQELAEIEQERQP